jgi:hypothetical protein
MTLLRKTLASLAAVTLTAALPAAAQVTHETKVSHDVSTHDGVTTRTTRVAHIRKIKTHRPKRILGVKVGHKTRKIETVHTTSSSTNGDYSQSETTHH